jgi:hypothetical protein
MALRFSTRLRNARLQAIEDTISTGARLEIRAGARPATLAGEDTGALLALIALPSDFLDAPAGGVTDLNGTWEDLTADGTGIAGYFRIYPAGSPSLADMDGTITATGGGGDMEVDNTSFNAGQSFTITLFQLTDGNAG